MNGPTAHYDNSINILCSDGCRFRPRFSVAENIYSESHTFGELNNSCKMWVFSLVLYNYSSHDMQGMMKEGEYLI